MLKNLICVCLLAIGAVGLAGASVDLPVSAQGKMCWTFRTDEKGVWQLKGDAVQWNGSAKTVMFKSSRDFPVTDYSRIRVRGEFQGSGTVQIGFHLYDGSHYLGTYPGEKYVFGNPEPVRRLENFRPLGAFASEFPDAAVKSPRMIPCVYVYPGTRGLFRNFSAEVTAPVPDHESVLSAPRPGDRFPLQRKLLLPEKIYAVEGTEVNLYFDNLFLVPSPGFYAFDVDCRLGSNFAGRWSCVPAAGQAGQYSLTLTVYGEEGIVARKSAVLLVAPAAAGKGRFFSLLMVGDSITDVTSFPGQVFRKFQAPGNPGLRMIGSRPGRPAPGQMAHEGYAGWAWETFLRRGPFVKLQNRDPELDIPGYFKQFNQGKAPDFITIQLGVNDIFGSSDFRIYGDLVGIEQRMDRLIRAFRKAAPKAVIGLGLPTPGASQDGFGRIYRCRQTRWQYKRNIFMLSERMIRKYGKAEKEGIFIVPMQTGLDCEHNFPMQDYPLNGENTRTVSLPRDGLHPAPAGGNQLGNTLYAWLKWQMK